MENSDRTFDMRQLERCDLLEIRCNDSRVFITVLKVNQHDVAALLESAPDMDASTRITLIGSALGEEPEHPHSQRFTPMQAIVGECLVLDEVGGSFRTQEIHSLRVTRGEEVIFDVAGGEPSNVHQLGQ